MQILDSEKKFYDLSYAFFLADIRRSENNNDSDRNF